MICRMPRRWRARRTGKLPWCVLALTTLSISACATRSATSDLTACPVPVPYTIEQRTRVADELKSLPGGAETREWIKDYVALREKARICAGKEEG